MASANLTRKRWRFVYLLNVAQRRVQHFIQSQSSGHTATRAGLLMALAPDRATPMGKLGSALQLGPPAISNLVERACKAGLVVRTPHPEDGRAWLVQLTPAGAKARKVAVVAARHLNAKLCEGFSDEELDTVARWLTAVQDRFPG